MLRRSQNLLDPQDYQALLKELDHPLRSSIRINPLKVQETPAEYIQQLCSRYQWESEAIPYCDHGWWINDGEYQVGQTWEHRLGNYYVQDASSMLPVELFDFDSSNSTPLILDMAASPGGKTTHLIAKTRDHGFIVANDASHDRITALRLVLQNWGSINHAVTQFPGEKIGAWYPQTFDCVLLDAPCSMQNLRSTEARPMRKISSREEGSLALRQKRLLESALQAVKVGGQIVYATCTLMPEEDEQVLNWLLQQYPSIVRIDDLQYRLPQPAPALTSDENHVFHPDVSKAIRVWPHRMRSSGFFTARLTKIADFPFSTASPPRFEISRTEFSPVEKSRQETLFDDFTRQFNLNLVEMLDQLNFSIWQYKQQVLAFPNQYFKYFSGMPVRSLGLPLALVSSEQWQPDHQWVGRFFSSFLPQSTLCPSDLIPAWKKGEDIELSITGNNAALHIILRDSHDQFLGIGRRQGDLLKNLLPKRMVL